MTPNPRRGGGAKREGEKKKKCNRLYVVELRRSRKSRLTDAHFAQNKREVAAAAAAAKGATARSRNMRVSIVAALRLTFSFTLM